ncbi:MAG: hypothetical protein RLZZ200_1934 [Pseudomonadota bacterium]|jgi:hypothetical protein
MSNRSGALSAALAGLFLAGPTVAGDLDVTAEPGDILGLFDQFVSSGAAATRCVEPGDALTLRFLSNFQWVSMQATREMGSRRPDATNKEISAALATRSLEIKAKTHALVQSEGCGSESVKTLVRRFLVHSTWKAGSL